MRLFLKAVSTGEEDRFQPSPSPNFESQENLEKIYYKCIPFNSFVCFEFSFKTSEILDF